MDIRNKLIGLTMIAVITLGLFLWDDPVAVRQEKNLNNEFQLVASFPGAKVISYRSGHKRGQAHVDAAYVTNASYNQIIQHYNRELAKKGWIFKRDKEIVSWGQKLPEAKIAYYVKGAYSLQIEYKVDQKDFTFAIGLGWGAGN